MTDSGSIPPKVKAKVVRCPQCGGDAVWSEANRYRPFCSERCKLIDLGAWAAETYRVPVQESPDDFPDLPEERLS